MADILFYEKPGCINNTRQKAILVQSGHVLETVNLLEHAWSKEELEKYLGEKPVVECFNPAAPAIKSGELNPMEFTKEEAIARMILEPLLIKRPLMKIGIHYIQGFDITVLNKLIDLDPAQGTADEKNIFNMNGMNACPHDNNLSCTKPEH